MPYSMAGKPACRCQIFILLSLTAFLFSACDRIFSTQDSLPVFSGSAMGAGYTVKLGAPVSKAVLESLRAETEKILQKVNQQMSTYSPDSELAQFNQSPSTEWFPVSPDTAWVIQKALSISRQTEGAFDVTVGPLVNLWGFGPDTPRDTPPTDEEIQAQLAKIGYTQLEVKDSALRKKRADLYIDLSAIAPGFAADKIAELLDQRQIRSYMVDVGGEIRVRGTKANHQPWGIAIERPVTGTRAIQRVVPLQNTSIATSGDYRNYFEKDGIRYSHMIDPKAGRPIRHNLASVSVILPYCVDADAFATAFMIMGTDKGYKFAVQHEMAVLFITKEGEGFVEKATPAFLQILPKKDSLTSD